MHQAHLEELGLLKVLERIEAGQGLIELPVRVGLMQRGLIDGGLPVTLTDLGRQLLWQLRERAMDGRES